MMLLDGKKLRNEIASELKTSIDAYVSKGYVSPKVAIIQVGMNKESTLFIENKKKFGQKIGVEVVHVHLPYNIPEDELLKEIYALNDDNSVHGVIIQMPVPKHIRREVCVEAISPLKDVDGLHSENVKALWVHRSDGIVPATTRGILTLLEHNGVLIEGRNVVVVGRSSLVGKPTAMAFLNKNATVTVCHSKTPNLEFYTTPADILIAAAGVPRLIRSQHVRPGQVVVDVGITIEEVPERVAVGDVHFDEVADIVHAISPVPGGVGPMTVASLFQNLFDAYTRIIKKG
ncbi:MAG: bifunctional 5,10-methylenetetrahydrofolate dehydrogenase/5,10-methenyltetrahydrofolate cyclohydrolase [Candidatus Taylorbacteria bacterium]|nr:bifunctional 5,10-methylenetetrahydrofolate dehydrogenase/5,10-methenyltetrahydrofolate cyclohydrolase [Candidatus Taylorbacteria bacterium]